jgi:hypothetical protein
MVDPSAAQEWPPFCQSAFANWLDASGLVMAFFRYPNLMSLAAEECNPFPYHLSPPRNNDH